MLPPRAETGEFEFSSASTFRSSLKEKWNILPLSCFVPTFIPNDEASMLFQWVTFPANQEEQTLHGVYLPFPSADQEHVWTIVSFPDLCVTETRTLPPYRPIMLSLVKVFDGRTFAEAHVSFTERLDGKGIGFHFGSCYHTPSGQAAASF